MQNYKNKLTYYDKREKEVMSWLVNGDIDFESYRKIKEQLDNDRNYARTELEKLTALIDNNNSTSTVIREDVVANFNENWQQLTNIEKRQFLTNFIKKIVIRNSPVEGKQSTAEVVSVEFNAF